MLNPDSVGSTFAGTDSVTLSQSEIDAFCAVIGESNTTIAPLKCAATIESYRVAAGNEIVSVRSDLHRDGKLVISAWSTLVVRA
ncbi:MAG: hypothetical protein NTW39_00440 [Actinobacteria bacterium]|nr:hypothetical protein [Actinomycetota bacterium]